MNNTIISNIRNLVLVLLGLSISLSVAVSNILIISLVILVLCEGDFKKKIENILSSKWMISLIFLLVLYLVYYFIFGLFTDTLWVLKRVSLLWTLPILYSSSFSEKIIQKSVFAFLFSMFFSSFLAISENFGFVNINNTNWTWAAFLQYTDHNAFLAVVLIIAIYIVCKLKIEKKYRNIIFLFIPFYLFSIFTEGGRAGQIVFLFLLVLLLIFLFKNKIKLLILSLTTLFIFSITIYNTSSMVKNRFHFAIKSIKEKDDSFRNILFLHTVDLIKQNPVFGYGTGSFTDKFGEINKQTKRTVNYNHKTPHNNYLYVWFELGALGIILLFSVFYFQIRELYKLKDGFVRILFPIMFLIIMLADSYFFSQNTLVLYLFLSVVTLNYQYKSS